MLTVTLPEGRFQVRDTMPAPQEIPRIRLPTWLVSRSHACTLVHFRRNRNQSGNDHTKATTNIIRISTTKNVELFRRRAERPTKNNV